MKYLAIQGSGYKGSPELQISTANQEIIPAKPANWTGGYKLYKFSFDNKQDVTVRLNNETTLFLEAEQGFEMERGDAPIFSFVVITSGVQFLWVGAY